MIGVAGQAMFSATQPGWENDSASVAEWPHGAIIPRQRYCDLDGANKGRLLQFLYTRDYPSFNAVMPSLPKPALGDGATALCASGRVSSVRSVTIQKRRRKAATFCLHNRNFAALI
jgi:hypothetical protein